MKVFDIISERNSLNEGPREWAAKYGIESLKDLWTAIRAGGTKAVIARKELVEKLSEKYAMELHLARTEGKPDPQIYAVLKKEIDSSGLAGKELKSLLDDVYESAQKKAALVKNLKDIEAATPLKGLTGKARDKMLEKRAFLSKEAKYAASNMIAGLPKGVYTTLVAAGLLVVAERYYTEVSFYESEYKKYLQNPAADNIYRQAKDKNDAWELYREDSDHALGKLVTEVGIILAPGVVKKLVSGGVWLASLIPIIGPVIGVTSKLMNLLMLMAQKAGSGASTASKEAVSAATRASVIAWLEGTEQGKEFIQQGIVGAIVVNIGTLSRKFFEKAAKLAQEYEGPGKGVVNPAGKALGSTTAAGGGLQKPGETPDEKAEKDRQAALPRTLRMTTDPGNPNIKYLNNMQVTDERGYLLTGLDKLEKDTEAEARQFGVANPLAGIKKDPNKKYGPGQY